MNFNVNLPALSIQYLKTFNHIYRHTLVSIFAYFVAEYREQLFKNNIVKSPGYMYSFRCVSTNTYICQLFSRYVCVGVCVKSLCM